LRLIEHGGVDHSILPRRDHGMRHPRDQHRDHDRYHGVCRGLLSDVAEVADLGGSGLVEVIVRLQTPGLDVAATPAVTLLLSRPDHGGCPTLCHGAHHAVTTARAIRVTNVVTMIDTTPCASSPLSDVAEVADLGGSKFVNLLVQLPPPGIDGAAKPCVFLLLPRPDHAGCPRPHHAVITACAIRVTTS
jgi:hypothetical protein